MVPNIIYFLTHSSVYSYWFLNYIEIKKKYILSKIWRNFDYFFFFFLKNFKNEKLFLPPNVLTISNLWPKTTLNVGY